MATEIYAAFEDSLETAYQSGKYPIMMLANKLLTSGKYQLRQIGKWEDGTNTRPETLVQRFKRLKEDDVDNTHADAPGDDYIALLNSAQKVEYETIKTAPTQQKKLLVQTKKGEKFDATGSAAPYERTIGNKVDNKMLSKEERATERIIAASTEIVLPLATLQDEELFAKTISGYVDDIEETVDEYKYNAHAVGIYRKRFGKIFARLQGKGYQLGTNTFGEAYSGGFNFEETDYLPSDILKSIRIGAAGDNTDRLVISIIMSDEAYLDAGMTSGVIEVHETLIRHDVVGHIYDDTSLVVDGSRIITISATISDLITAGFISATTSVQPKVND